MRAAAGPDAAGSGGGRMTSHAGQQALNALDQALAGRPGKDDHAFAAATDHLCIMREGMIHERRATGGTAESRRRLEHVNSVLTVVLGGDFSLGSIPWEKIEKLGLGSKTSCTSLSEQGSDDDRLAPEADHSRRHYGVDRRSASRVAR